MTVSYLHDPEKGTYTSHTLYQDTLLQDLQDGLKENPMIINSVKILITI
jgi:hypothetical protein